jgi:alkylhydroperoxidase family enzyme
MSSRVDLHRVSPKAVEELISFREFAGVSGLNEPLVTLVKTYVSEVQNCTEADTFRRKARAIGVSEQRLSTLSSWRYAPLFTERERAALAWSDCVTRMPLRVSDSEYVAAREWFTEEELVDLTVVIVATSAYNQVTLSFAAGPDPCADLSSGSVSHP